MGRRASTLEEEEPQITIRRTDPELPVKTVVDQLTVTEGRRLEILTRTNPDLCRAVQVGFLFGEVYGLEIVREETEQLMRLAISAGGKGREELIGTLEAAGQPPAGYGSDRNKGRTEYSFYD